jgi:hypothetical protein
LDGIDILSLLFSALIHDYKHPGYSNTYLIQTSSDISTHYNGNLREFSKHQKYLKN